MCGGGGSNKIEDTAAQKKLASIAAICHAAQEYLISLAH